MRPPSLPPHFPLPALGDPPPVKVFGILHLTFAILGLLWGTRTFFGNRVSPITLPHIPDLEPTLLRLGIGLCVMSAAVTVASLIAGILLLKKRKSGLLWSNIYAWMSLLTKAAMLCIVFSTIAPALFRLQKSIGYYHGFPVITVIPLAIITLIVLAWSAYPAITLMVLNKPAIRQWFATRPN
ncbi:MAG: hypothetical protein QM627_11370 [Luteolibacter sp.]